MLKSKTLGFSVVPFTSHSPTTVLGQSSESYRSQIGACHSNQQAATLRPEFPIVTKSQQTYRRLIQLCRSPDKPEVLNKFTVLIERRRPRAQPFTELTVSV